MLAFKVAAALEAAAANTNVDAEFESHLRSHDAVQEPRHNTIQVCQMAQMYCATPCSSCLLCQSRIDRPGAFCMQIPSVLNYECPQPASYDISLISCVERLRFQVIIMKFIAILVTSIALTMFYSSRERNAVWLLEKARKANTRMLASVVPEEVCDRISAEALSNGRCLPSPCSPSQMPF